VKIIDAHAHIGHLGGLFNVGIDAGELVAQMDEHGIERTLTPALDNRVQRAAAEQSDRLVPTVWVNPTESEDAVHQVEHYIGEGFRASSYIPS